MGGTKRVNARSKRDEWSMMVAGCRRSVAAKPFIQQIKGTKKWAEAMSGDDT